MKHFLRSLIAVAAFLSCDLCLNAQTIMTVGYTGSVSTFTIPGCVNSITVDAQGAQGGSSGGMGGRVQCVMPVSPGDVLSFYVGGQGGSQGSSAAGGFNGGGTAGYVTSQYPGAGGGGATDIRLNGTSLSNRIIVAGGGGGSHAINSNSNAGLGGGLQGGNVASNSNGCLGTWATGGTQTNGGNAATSSGVCCSFVASTVTAGFGQGGNGSGPSSSCNGGDGGAGGGGGWYGGGGGGGYSAGAGGSSYTHTLATGVTHTQGYRSGNGTLTFTYNTTGAGVTATAATNPICIGTTATLTAGSVSSYTWLPVGTFTGANTAVITDSPSATTSYTVVGLNSFGCTSTLVITMTVIPTVPSLTVANTASATGLGVCSGKTVALTASGASSYSWTGSVSNGVAFSPTATSGYTVTGTNACGSTTAVTSVSINPAPTVSAVASQPTLCSGNTLTLTAVGNGTPNVWTVGTSTITNPAVFFPSATANYTVTAYSSQGCTNTAQIQVTVVTTPILAPTVSPPLICFGKSSTLTASGAAVYSWSPVGSSNSMIVVSPTVTTTYTVVKSNANCVDTKVVTVNVAALPFVFAISNPTLVCANKTTTLSGGGANNYTWTNGVQTQTGANVVYSPSVSTNYTVTGFDGTCTNVTTVSVSVNPNPTITIAVSNSVLCRGQTASLTASGAVNYTWTTTTPTTTGATIVVTPTTSTLYSVIGENSFTCSSTNGQVVIVNPNPTVTATTNKLLVCIGGSATLTAGGGAQSFTWDAQAGNVISPTVVVNPTVTTTYTATGQYTATGCTSTKTVQVQVFSPTLTVNSPTSSCAGGTVNLIATGGDNNSYTWTPVSNLHFNTIPVSPPSPTVYYVSAMTTSSGVKCPSAGTFVVNIYVNPTVTAASSRTFICKYEATTLTAGGAQTYVWSDSQTGQVIFVSPVVPITIYTVTGTDQNSCVGAATLQVKVSNCIGIAENELNDQSSMIKVYPNPNHGEFMIQSGFDLDLTLYNDLGQDVGQIKLQTCNQHQYLVKDLPPGIYFISGEKDQLKINEKVIITK